MQEVEQLSAEGRTEEAITLLQRIHQEYADDPSAAVTLADFYGKQQRYAESVRYYEEGLARLRPAGASPKALAIVHSALANGYNELGQQRYFSPELCLRILYHLEQVWPYFTEIGYRPEDVAAHVEFARKTAGHYDMAKLGVRMMEVGSREEVAATVGQEQPELVLYPDGIDETTKLQAKDAIVARIRTFDEAKPSEYATMSSDRSVDEVLAALDRAFRSLTSVHYRKYQQQDEREELVEETWYQQPAILKTHQRHQDRDGWFLIRDGQMISFDPEQRTRGAQEPVEGEPGWLMELRKPHAAYLLQGYTLDVRKLSIPPAFLGSLYQGQPAANLYVLTGASKQPDGFGWPPVVKIEYVVDLDRGLLVGLREYWHGVLGSGREEELATTDVVAQWHQDPGGIYLPVAGRREQLVDELPGHRIDRSTWRMEYERLNQAVNPAEFELSRYTVGE